MPDPTGAGPTARSCSTAAGPPDSTQRLNRAALPHARARRDGLVVRVGSTSARGGTPPCLGPCFAPKAGEGALAVSCAAELSRFGIETTIVVPGSFTTGTNHVANAASPADAAVAEAYEEEHAGLADQVDAKLADHVRTELHRRIELGDLLHPTTSAGWVPAGGGHGAPALGRAVVPAGRRP